MKRKIIEIGIFCIAVTAGVFFLIHYANHDVANTQEIKTNLQPQVYEFEPNFVYRDGQDSHNMILNTDQSQIKIEFYTITNGTYYKISKPQFAYPVVAGTDGYDHADYSRPIYNGMTVKIPDDNNPIYMAVTAQTNDIYIAPNLIVNKYVNPDIMNYTLGSINNNLLKSWIFELNSTNIKNDTFDEMKWSKGAIEPIRYYYIMYYPSSYYNETKTVNSLSP